MRCKPSGAGCAEECRPQAPTARIWPGQVQSSNRAAVWRLFRRSQPSGGSSRPAEVSCPGRSVRCTLVQCIVLTIGGWVGPLSIPKPKDTAYMSILVASVSTCFDPVSEVTSPVSGAAGVGGDLSQARLHPRRYERDQPGDTSSRNAVTMKNSASATA